MVKRFREIRVHEQVVLSEKDDTFEARSSEQIAKKGIIYAQAYRIGRVQV